MRYQPNNLLGIGLMLLAMLLFVLMDTIAKGLVSVQISAIQVIAVRSWIILPIILLTLAARGEISQLATRKPLQHLLRGYLSVAGYSVDRSLDRRRHYHRLRALRNPS